VTTRLIVIALAGLASTHMLGSILPERLGDFARDQLSAVNLATPDRQVLEEYGLVTAERAEFTKSDHRRFIAEGFQFTDSEGGHAAYLWLRPPRAARSPLGGTTSNSGGVWGQTYGVVGGGTTVVEKKNYVFRFRCGAPENAAIDDLLNGLRNFDPTEPRPDECCAYFVEGSDRMVLGPVSLARLVPRIPPSAAGFHIGVKGRLALYETPSGPLTLTVFEYPSVNAAIQQAAYFERIRGALVRVEGKSVGVILDPVDGREAEGLLHGIDYTSNREVVGWDPRFISDPPLTVEGGIGAMLAGALIGLILAVPRYLVRWKNGIPEAVLKLRI
jgi:hypothetical protein